MFKFFRQLRKNQLMSDKTRKYIFYAIGEILLVVVGILIALQVNNWNEKRLVEEEVNAIVLNLNSEFRENLEQLNNDLQRIDSVLYGLEGLLEQTLEKNNSIAQHVFNELLETTFTTPTWSPSSVVVEELKYSGGFSRLNDETLKRLLFDWERHYLNQQSILDGYNMYAEEYIEYITLNGSVRTLDAISGTIPDLKPSAIAENNLRMLRDPLFENRIDNFYFLAYLLRDSYRESAVKLKAIIEHTEKN